MERKSIRGKPDEDEELWVSMLKLVLSNVSNFCRYKINA